MEEEVYKPVYIAAQGIDVAAINAITEAKIYYVATDANTVVIQASVINEDTHALIVELLTAGKKIVLQSGAPINPPKYPPGA